MNHLIDTEKVKHGRRTYTINVYPDEATDSPLENDEGVFITCSSSSRSGGYGNKPCSHEEQQEIGLRIAKFFDQRSGRVASLANALSDDPALDIGDPLIGLPVYVYEHGQVSMSTSAFSCPWDSGQSGFIYITPKTALEWQGGKRLTKRKIERVLKNLEAIVEEYGKWCNGECYYYTVTDENGDKINDIGCGGYIGTEYMMECARGEIAAYHKQRVKEACERRIAVAKERIERLFWAARDVVTA